MLKLKNEQLEVEILHPIDNQQHFGVRYCTGGYIFQIHDVLQGPLMSGPTYPDSFNWFDGQGIPDAFNLSPLCQPNGNDELVEIIGVGRCDLMNKKVIKFCDWEIEHSVDSITMITLQQFEKFKFNLERTVSLKNRTIRSLTTIKNQGNALIPMRWFPHPFYPQPNNDELCSLNIPVTMSENVGYFVSEDGFISRKGQAIEEGFYQELNLKPQEQKPLALVHNHPILGEVSAYCSYAPSFFPIWGNQNTFSWEPFLEKSIAQHRSLSWSIDYNF